jgi:hypothetical protein
VFFEFGGFVFANWKADGKLDLRLPAKAVGPAPDWPCTIIRNSGEWQEL